MNHFVLTILFSYFWHRMWLKTLRNLGRVIKHFVLTILFSLWNSKGSCNLYSLEDAIRKLQLFWNPMKNFISAIIPVKGLILCQTLIFWQQFLFVPKPLIEYQRNTNLWPLIASQKHLLSIVTIIFCDVMWILSMMHSSGVVTQCSAIHNWAWRLGLGRDGCVTHALVVDLFDIINIVFIIPCRLCGDLTVN